MEIPATGNRGVLSVVEESAKVLSVVEGLIRYRMRQTIKYLTTRLYKPLLVKYLSATRTYTYKGIRLLIPPAVFHPGFFFSTRLLLRYIDSLPLQNKSFLEPGAGSGLISLYAARKGAIVTATDINPVAISFLEGNRHINRLQIGIIQSDLFTKIPQQAFDIIAINPPYYKKQPRTAAEYAWYCGERGEYFEHLFKDLHNYIHAQSVVLMVLCDGCDIQMIKDIAAQYNFKLNCVQTKKNWVETNYIFQIVKGESSMVNKIPVDHSRLTIDHSRS